MTLEAAGDHVEQDEGAAERPKDVSTGFDDSLDAADPKDKLQLGDGSPCSTFAPESPSGSLASPAGTWASLSSPHATKTLSSTCPGGFGRSGSDFVKQGVRRVRTPGGSPFNVAQPYRGPKHPFISKEVDIHGFPNVQVRQPKHSGDWDDRHQLHLFTEGRKAGDRRADNSLLPRGTRLYYSVPDTLPQLKRHLKKCSNSAPLLRALDQPEQRPAWSFASCDASPTQMPEKHTYGGNMVDRDGKVRMWNDRWEKSIAWMNEGMHKSHRQYFVEQSLFEEAPSQQWRRYRDQEIAHGVWVPTKIKKPPIFTPMGV